MQIQRINKAKVSLALLPCARMAVVLSASPRGEGSRVAAAAGGGGGAAAAAVAALDHGHAGGSHGCCRCRGDNGPVAMTPVVVGARREHGVDRADAGARGDLAVAGV